MTKHKKESFTKTYRIFSDIILGINTRKTDNIIQLKIVLSIVLSFVLSAFIWKYFYGDFMGMEDNLGTFMIGLIIGMFIAMFISGTYIAFYRLIQHIKGNHK